MRLNDRPPSEQRLLDTAPSPPALTARVKALARGLGFDPVGITSAAPFVEAERITLERLRAGMMDGLPWFHEQRVRRGARPEALLPGARSVVSLALPYHTPAPQVPEDGKPRGRVSRYAWAADYHKVIERRTKELTAAIKQLGGTARAYVDYGPLPDRAVAGRAGVGWFGKHTNLITSGQGSWVFLAEVITDLELAPDQPLKKSCGACTACIPSCPTGAIVAPYTIDNTRCISYHTIENRGPIPREMRPLMSDWIYGCDLCQDACPVNHRAGARSRLQGDAAFAAASVESSRPDLIALLSMTEAEFLDRYRGSPIRRAKYAGFLRNVCVALGNSASPGAVPSLVRALAHEAPLVRGHAAWALGRIGGDAATGALRTALLAEYDPWVREELRLALGWPDGSGTLDRPTDPHEAVP